MPKHEIDPRAALPDKQRGSGVDGKVDDAVKEEIRQGHTPFAARLTAPAATHVGDAELIPQTRITR